MVAIQKKVLSLHIVPKEPRAAPTEQNKLANN